jgi:outer membrane protein TolC
VEATPLPLELVGADAPESAMIASALASRPEVRAARFQAVAAHEDWRGVTRGPLLPDVRAGYEGGGFGSDFGDLGGTERFGVGLEWKIGPGGLLDGPARDAAAARYQAAHLREERVRSEIVREVAEARAAVLSRAAAIRSAEHGVRDAAEAQTLFDERRREGVGGALEAVLAEETLTQARLDYLDGVIEHNKAQLRLMHALGVLR